MRQLNLLDKTKAKNVQKHNQYNQLQYHHNCLILKLFVQFNQPYRHVYRVEPIKPR